MAKPRRQDRSDESLDAEFAGYDEVLESDEVLWADNTCSVGLHAWRNHLFVNGVCERCGLKAQ
jgi:hypothetical protein